MSTEDTLYSRARIPYGTWGTSFFPAWQTSALAEVNIGQFAAESMNRILGLRRVPTSSLEYLILGSTIPWHWKFWNAPMLSAAFGRRIPGYHLEQACATGLQAVLAAAAQVDGQGGDVSICQPGNPGPHGECQIICVRPPATFQSAQSA